MIGRLSQTRLSVHDDGSRTREARVELMARDRAGRLDPTGEMRPFAVRVIPGLRHGTLVTIRPGDGGRSDVETYHGD